MTASKPAASRMNDVNLADAADELARLVMAAWMAAEALADRDHQGALQTILDLAENKLGSIKEELYQRLLEAQGAAA